MDRIEVYIRETDFDFYTEFSFIKYEGGKRYIAKPMEFVELPKGGTVCEPSLQVSSECKLINSLKDNLKRLGYIDNASKIEAIKYHLEDMRKLVFSKEKD